MDIQNEVERQRTGSPGGPTQSKEVPGSLGVLSRHCSNCGTTKQDCPVMRSGPESTTLCNACGLYWKKNGKMRDIAQLENRGRGAKRRRELLQALDHPDEVPAPAPARFPARSRSTGLLPPPYEVPLRIGRAAPHSPALRLPHPPNFHRARPYHQQMLLHQPRHPRDSPQPTWQSSSTITLPGSTPPSPSQSQDPASPGDGPPAQRPRLAPPPLRPAGPMPWPKTGSPGCALPILTLAPTNSSTQHGSAEEGSSRGAGVLQASPNSAFRVWHQQISAQIQPPTGRVSIKRSPTPTMAEVQRARWVVADWLAENGRLQELEDLNANMAVLTAQQAEQAEADRQRDLEQVPPQWRGLLRQHQLDLDARQQAHQDLASQQAQRLAEARQAAPRLMAGMDEGAGRPVWPNPPQHAEHTPLDELAAALDHLGIPMVPRALASLVVGLRGLQARGASCFRVPRPRAPTPDAAPSPSPLSSSFTADGYLWEAEKDVGQSQGEGGVPAQAGPEHATGRPHVNDMERDGRGIADVLRMMLMGSI